MKRFEIGDTSYGGFSKGERVRVARLVEPDSTEGMPLFYNVVDELLAGRKESIEGQVADFLPDDGDHYGERAETLIYVGNSQLPFPQSLALYACRELVHVGAPVTAEKPEN